MSLYRISTENKNRNDIIKVVSRYFEGFTLIEGIGYWKGKQEKSLIIEIDTISADYHSTRRIENICNDIKLLNGQEYVLLQKFCGCVSTFV